jgi:pimeloyl-ACP methyl ester carboxylesterase
MFSPGGFDGTLDKWSNIGVYAKIKFLDHLPQTYSCIVFDRRETGQSGGRVERVTWEHYVAQGKGLLEHLGIKRAHMMGGCMGCPPVAAFALAHPGMVASMVLFWPVGGAKYRIRTQQNFTDHIAFVQERGLAGVVEVAQGGSKAFGADPRGGPWVSVLRNDRAFADAFVRQDVERYKGTVLGMMRGLFDRDTAPGAEPEDMMRCDIPAVVIPGNDASHATSAARYLQECLPRSEYWDMPVERQTEDAANPRVLEFLDKVRV